MIKLLLAVLVLKLCEWLLFDDDRPESSGC